MPVQTSLIITGTGSIIRYERDQNFMGFFWETPQKQQTAQKCNFRRVELSRNGNNKRTDGVNDSHAKCHIKS